MNIKNKLITLIIFFSILTLTIINLKNPEKTKIYLFTSKIEEISLGNLITIAFLAGFTFSSLSVLMSSNNSQESLEDNYINDEEIDKTYENNINQEIESNRPPERDVRESQPTISVNYRFVDQDENSYSSKNIKKTTNDLNNEENDWLNSDNEW